MDLLYVSSFLPSQWGRTACRKRDRVRQGNYANIIKECLLSVHTRAALEDLHFQHTSISDRHTKKQFRYTINLVKLMLEERKAFSDFHPFETLNALVVIFFKSQPIRSTATKSYCKHFCFGVVKPEAIEIVFQNVDWNSAIYIIILQFATRLWCKTSFVCMLN